MFEKYSLFYSYKEMGDVLLIVFNQKEVPTSFINKGDVTLIYHESEVIGYNIFNISKIVKIKTKGLIYFPSNVFIDIINNILRNNQLEDLAYFTHSGYLIGEVIKLEQPGSLFTPFIDIGDKILKGQNLPHINLNDKVVVALKGATLYDGGEANEMSTDLHGHICSNRELNISIDDEIYLVDEDGIIGEDFFQIGEQKNGRN